MDRLLVAALCLLLAGLYSPPSHASEPIEFYAGSHIGTYRNISQDIQQLLKKKNIKLNLHTTDGSIDNIKRIAVSEAPSIGLVQADVLHFMSRSSNPDTQNFANRIRMIMPLYQEEVHILANKRIKSFADLKGKKIVVGEEGSGNMLTAVNLLALSNIRVGETLRLTPPKGVLAVLEGKADAVVYVGGKPVKLFKNIESLETADGKKFSALLDDVHFIPITSPEVLAEYRTATIHPEDYSFVSKPIPTVAVQAVLITGNYTAAKMKKQCQLIHQAATIIRQNISQLKRNGHPKWRSAMGGDSSLWKTDRCSLPATDNNPSHKKSR